MSRTVLLDSGPLGEITHPRAERNLEAREWMGNLVASGAFVVLPEIVDYELRRKLLHLASVRSLRHLDEMKGVVFYAPLSTAVMLRAATLWAEARRRGLPTAPEGSIDIDAILAAQALELSDDDSETTVATTNPRHLSHFVEARNWQDITP